MPELLHDPVRPRLYGVDTDQAAVVVIDDTTLRAIRTIVIGSTPRDIDIDAAGTTLFVAHDDVTAVARIRLDTSSFAAFVPTRRFPTRLAVATGSWLVIVDRQQFNTPTLVDAVAGAVVSTSRQILGGLPAATADGAIQRERCRLLGRGGTRSPRPDVLVWSRSWLGFCLGVADPEYTRTRCASTLVSISPPTSDHPRSHLHYVIQALRQVGPFSSGLRPPLVAAPDPQLPGPRWSRRLGGARTGVERSGG